MSKNTIKNYSTDLNCFKKFIDLRKIKDLSDFTVEQMKHYDQFLVDSFSKDNTRKKKNPDTKITF